jgi:hypothetical protein
MTILPLFSQSWLYRTESGLIDSAIAECEQKWLPLAVDQALHSMPQAADINEIERELLYYFENEPRATVERRLRDSEEAAENRFRKRRDTENWRRKDLRAGPYSDSIRPGAPPPPEDWAALEYAETRLKAMTKSALQAIGMPLRPESFVAFVKRAIQSLCRLCIAKLGPWEDTSNDNDDRRRTKCRNASWFFLSHELSGAVPRLEAEARRINLQRSSQASETGDAEDVATSTEACDRDTDVCSPDNMTAEHFVYQMMHGLSPSGLVDCDQALSEGVYLEAYADFISASEGAFTAELPPGKPCSDLLAQASVVRRSKRLAELALGYFEAFTGRISEKYHSQLALGGDPALTGKWQQAVIHIFAPKLWRDVAAVWTGWIARVRTITGGTAYGACIRTIEDPEYLILAAHERRMREALDQIADRYAIPAPIIRNVLAAAERSKLLDPSDFEPVGSTEPSRNVLVSREGTQEAIRARLPEIAGECGTKPPQTAAAEITADLNFVAQDRCDANPEPSLRDKLEPPHSDLGRSGATLVSCREEWHEAAQPEREATSRVASTERRSDDAKAAKQSRAITVAKLIRELNDIKPQMLEDEAEYNRIAAQYPSFLTFTIAANRPDLKLKVLSIRGSTRHIRLAQELAGAHHGKQLSTIQDDWKDHKPAEFRRKA